ncbi:MAG: hypothetical protein Q9210_006178, partial [Variospora velana]
MTSLTLNDKIGNSSLLPSDTVLWANLDTGATFTYLPEAMTGALYAAAGVLNDASTYNASAVSCNLSTADANFTFGFEGPNGQQISVSVRELVTPIPPETGSFNFAGGTPACIFGVYTSESKGLGQGAILGDSLLRSAYAVFDLESHQIALAQARNDQDQGSDGQDDSTVKPITRGKDGIPGVAAQISALPYPQSYIDAYKAAQSSLEAPAGAGALTAAFAGPPVPAVVGDVRLMALPPTASFTAEAAVTPTPAPDSGQPGSEGTSKGVMDVRITAGVLYMAFIMAAAAM